MWIVFITYVVVSYVLSLRGNEGFLLDLSGLNQFWSRNDGTYFIIALLGKIKGENVDQMHLIPCSNITSSGIEIKAIVDQLRVAKISAGFKDGPAISDIKGGIVSSSDLDGLLFSLLEDLFEEQNVLFPPEIKTILDIKERYHSSRTWRRTADTRVIETNVSDKDIDVVNRWKQVESAKGKRPNQPMKQHYAQVELLLAPFKRYTHAM